MKRVVTILLAVLMLVSVLTVTSSAKGYILSIPSTVSAHNLEAYGLHTMNVYSTEIAPTVDGKVDLSEYPGPNNGLALSSTYGDNMFASSFNIKTGTGDQNGYYPQYDFTRYIPKEDFPDYINTYLTYDDEYLYFAVSTVVPAIRVTTTSDSTPVYGDALLRNGTWYISTRVNFSQDTNIGAAHNNSLATNNYTLLKYPGETTAQSVTFTRQITVKSGSSFTTASFSNYVDEIGQQWNSTVYKRPENFTYKVTILPSGKWGIVFEGRQLLEDILRVTDVEYDDGTPIDYVPEWGVWGFNMRLQTTRGSVNTLPDGSELEILPDDHFYVQTFLPCGGQGRTGSNTILGEYVFANTLTSAITSGHGKSTNYLLNPVHFLGRYDQDFNYDGVYSEPEGTVKVNVRSTRNRGVALTSGVRGVNNRVVGAATRPAGATGDSITSTVILAVAMLVCAVVAVAVVFMKKRSSRNC